MNLEIGKTFKTRAGYMVTVFEVNPEDIFPVKADYYQDGQRRVVMYNLSGDALTASSVHFDIEETVEV